MNEKGGRKESFSGSWEEEGSSCQSGREGARKEGREKKMIQRNAENNEGKKERRKSNGE